MLDPTTFFQCTEKFNWFPTDNSPLKYLKKNKVYGYNIENDIFIEQVRNYINVTLEAKPINPIISA